MIDLLLKNGASTNILMGDAESRLSILEYAVQQHATHIIKLLLAYGANPNCGSPHILLQALQTGQKSIATLLKRQGAKIGGTLLNDKARLFTKKPKSYSSPIQAENSVSLTNPSGNPL